MKDKDTLRNVLIAGGVFLITMGIISRLMPPVQPPPAATQQAAPGSDAAPIAPATGTATPATPGAGTAGTAATAEGYTFAEAAEAQTLYLGAALTNGVDKKAPPSPYRMRLALSNIGASVESATATDHAEILGSDERYGLLSLIEYPDGKQARSLAIERITIDSIELPVDNRRWHASGVTETANGQLASFSLDILQNGQPALTLTRTFKLERQQKGSGWHDLTATITVTNRSPSPHQVIVTYRGGLGLRRLGTRMDDRHVDVAVFDGARVSGARTQQTSVSSADGGTVELFAPHRDAPDSRFAWAATGNTYFTCTVAPLTPDGKDNPAQIVNVSAVDLDGSATTDDDVTIRIVSAPTTIETGQALSYPADIYLGEKDADAFRDVPRYAARNYYYQVSQGFGSCTFTWLVEVMIWLLNTLHAIVPDYGIAIIIMVLIVRTLLHPITKKGQIGMVHMQQRTGDLAPKIAELKRKYPNDKAKVQQETMKLYREMGINPGTQLLNCLPMGLQMPIWFALFVSLSSNIGMRHEPLHFTWIRDMTAQDALYTFASPVVIPLVGWELPSFNLLPLLLAVFMYAQQKLQPKPKPNPNASAEQRQQQEMMQKMGPMMSIMMLFFFYKMPSGLNLYIMASSAFGIIEQKRIRRHIKEQEEKGPDPGPVTPKPSDGPPPKKPGKPSFLERLQTMADEAQKTKAKGGKKTGKRKK